jgi:UDPglucose 6-dehydrogenase
MKLTVFGAGYVGLVTGACLADLGHHVLIVDTNLERVAQLREGRIPIHEPGLAEIVRRNAKGGRLSFDASPASQPDADAYFIAVGTPPKADGDADLTAVWAVARTIFETAKEDAVVVVKSTVPVGTCDGLQHFFDGLSAEHRSTKVLTINDDPFFPYRPTLEVVSNPEFLKEGDAINDFFKPDRIVVGTGDEEAADVMRAIYAPLQLSGERPLIVTDRRSSELVKYASNAMLALRISFMNEVARLCHAAGADVHDVRLGVGSDSRIGKKFLYAGPGYGGSCFPKDVQALAATARRAGQPMQTVEAAHRANQAQRGFVLDLIAQYLGGLEGKTIALWGLAFKPETDDIRESPALALTDGLAFAGARVVGHDPEAADNFARHYAGSAHIALAQRQEEALAGADALVLLTEWRCYRNPDWDAAARLLKPGALVLDARNVWRASDVNLRGLKYQGIGTKKGR